MIRKTVIVAWCLLTSFVTGVTAVYAGSHLQEVKAYLNGDVSFLVLRKSWVPQNRDGSVLLPITYEGTTYVPLRAVSNTLNIPVDYDSENNTVLIGQMLDGVNHNTPLISISFTEDQKQIIEKSFTFQAHLPTKIVNGDEWLSVHQGEDSSSLVFKHMLITQSQRNYFMPEDGGDSVQLSNGINAVWYHMYGEHLLFFPLGKEYVTLSSPDLSLSKEQLEKVAASFAK